MTLAAWESVSQTVQSVSDKSSVPRTQIQQMKIGTHMTPTIKSAYATNATD